MATHCYRVRANGLIVRAARNADGELFQMKTVGKLYPWGLVLNEAQFPALVWHARIEQALAAREREDIGD